MSPMPLNSRSPCRAEKPELSDQAVLMTAFPS